MKKEIVKKFLDVGIQLSRDALEYFDGKEEKVESFIEEFQKEKDKPKIVTLSTIRKIMESGDSLDVKITEITTRKGKISINDLVKNITGKYDLLKGIIEERGALKGLISINKITQNTKEFSIICMVVSFEEGFAAVEDTTGELDIKIDTKDEILPDDVIGLVCEQKDGRIFAKEVIWPDISLKREVKKSTKSIECAFIGGEFFTDKNVLPLEDETIIFVFGRKRELNLSITPKKIVFLVETTEKDSKDAFKLPVITEIDGMSILIFSMSLMEKYSKYWKTPEEIIKNLLKRRDVCPSQEICDYESPVLITPPDIVAFVGENGVTFNYKGTSILSIPKDGGYCIDLNTRDVNKL